MIKYLLILVCVLGLAYSAHASIPLSSNFSLGSQLSLDNRLIVADNTARDAISSAVRYRDMIVCVTSSDICYQLKGGITNSNWVISDSGSIVTSGTFSSPILLTSAGSYTVPTTQRTRVYVKGNGGAVIDPVLSNGTGTQELYLLGTDSTNTVTLTNSNSGSNLIMSGSIVLRTGSMICLHWGSDVGVWIEDHRNEM